MPPKRKRDVDPDMKPQSEISEPESKRWRSGSGMGYPRDADGDITISLSDKAEDDLVLCRHDLSRMCDYFRGFDGATGLQRFYLHPSIQPKDCRVVLVSRERISHYLT
jgi:hypothetical protein